MRLDYASMVVDQVSDLGFQALRTAVTALRLEDFAFDDAGITLLCDISTAQPRPVVPARWRRQIFTVHSLSHPGKKPSQRLVAAKFVWHGLKKDVRKWAETCVVCQCSKVHRHTKASLAQFSVPERRFDHVNVDLVGPLPPSHGSTHLLTIVDRTTSCLEAVPLSSTTTAKVVRTVIRMWIARFGVLSNISSDRGPQFTALLPFTHTAARPLRPLRRSPWPPRQWYGDRPVG